MSYEHVIRKRHTVCSSLNSGPWPIASCMWLDLFHKWLIHWFCVDKRTPTELSIHKRSEVLNLIFSFGFQLSPILVPLCVQFRRYAYLFRLIEESRLLAIDQRHLSCSTLWPCNCLFTGMLLLTCACCGYRWLFVPLFACEHPHWAYQLAHIVKVCVSTVSIWSVFYYTCICCTSHEKLIGPQMMPWSNIIIFWLGVMLWSCYV